MTTVEILLLIVVLLIALPWVSYTAVKLGTVGYLRGREIFHTRNEEKKNNGS